ncbi:MAG: hypothetical protein A2Y10_06160 [Planctomycetes bacterium GWF2_41_51]|nr:MAG: hypothetical protein A2Y10_06160 [Planctomycetes bacterium GWF2_41_51]HBG26470.1 hypothetical protein [Phycisphaerales bacterium]
MNKKKLSIVLVLVCVIIAGITSATSITISNPGFESGSSSTDATSWDRTSGIYYESALGDYSEGSVISGRAASLKSTGGSYVQQTLSGVYADSYDIYQIDFGIGYRCDSATEGDIKGIRISLWDLTDNVEVAGETIMMGDPGVDSSQTPNVDVVVDRRVYLKLWGEYLPHHPVALRLANNHNAANPENATAVIDNIEVHTYRRMAHWDFDSNLEDETGGHDASALPNKSVNYSSGGIEDDCLYLRPSSGYYGCSAVNSGAFNYDNFTLSGWVYMSSWGMNLGTQSLVSYRDTGSNASGFTFYCDNNDKWLFHTGSSAGYDSLTGPSIVSGQWNHFTLTFEKTGTYSASEAIGAKRMYINGQMVASKSNVRYKYAVPEGPFLIGAGKPETYPTCDYFFNGYLDDVRYHNWRMSNAAVADLYGRSLDDAYADTCDNIRLMTYNIHYGKGTDGVLSLSRIADVIEDSGADIIGLQEVDYDHERSNHVDQAAWLANNLDMYYAYGLADATGTVQGNAILSKYPILSVNNWQLPLYGSEDPRRAVMVATILVEGKVIHFGNTHLTQNREPYYVEVRNFQVKEILKRLNEFTEAPIFLAGDFNSRRSYPPMDRLKHMFRDSYDLAASKVNDQDYWDHIMVCHKFTESGGDVSLNKTIINSLTQVASDHYPQFADVEP